jgi:hypothetical protein
LKIRKLSSVAASPKLRATGVTDIFGGIVGVDPGLLAGVTVANTGAEIDPRGVVNTRGA